MQGKRILYSSVLALLAVLVVAGSAAAAPAAPAPAPIVAQTVTATPSVPSCGVTAAPVAGDRGTLDQSVLDTFVWTSVKTRDSCTTACEFQYLHCVQTVCGGIDCTYCDDQETACFAACNG